jgi:hypothetical protein
MNCRGVEIAWDAVHDPECRSLLSGDVIRNGAQYSVAVARSDVEREELCDVEQLSVIAG